MTVELQPSAVPTPQLSERIGTEDLTDEQIVHILNGYKDEAENARRGGPAARDNVWDSNVRLYWNLFDYSDKAPWQSREAMPEAPMFVDRWAAAMRDALIASGEWYSILDPKDREGDLTLQIRKFMDLHLSRAMVGPSGQHMGFDAVFEDAMKLAAMMAACASVTWKIDSEGRGFVAIETVDPREVWYDPTGRGLYRIRRMEIDRFRLHDMRKMHDAEGKPIFNQEALDRLDASLADQDRARQEELAGHGREQTSNRKPIVLHEYLCTLIDSQGNKLGDNLLCVVANDRFLIRGPEPNPFWHKRDWLSFAPAVNVPLSVYGRSYMENWSSVARTFVEMTNLIVDATHFSAIKAFATIPSMLEDPSELSDGVHPGKTFALEEGGDPRLFLHAVDLGQLPHSAVTIWQSLKTELREGAAFNEIALGQTPPKGGITATEINQTQQSSHNLMSSIARSIESRFLEPLLDLVWKTALQHLSEDDVEVRETLGDEWFQVFLERRQEFASRRFTFRARGISSMIERSMKLQSYLQMLQIVGQSEQLMQLVFQKIDPGMLIDEMLILMGIDQSKFQPSPRQQQVNQIMMQQAMPGQSSPAEPEPA